MSQDPEARQASGRDRTPSSELDARKLEAIALFISDPNKTRVAERIGVDPRTVSRWFQEPVFVAEYHRQLDDVRLDLWAQMNSSKDTAWAQFMGLLSGGPPAISLRASMWFLDRLLFPPKFTEWSEALQTGIAESLRARERQLLESAGVLERDDAAHDDPNNDDEEAGGTK